MNRKTSLVFIIYHMTDGEKKFFDKRLPFFIRWWLFPKWANKEGINVWKYSSFFKRSVTKGSKLIYGGLCS